MEKKNNSDANTPKNKNKGKKIIELKEVLESWGIKTFKLFRPAGNETVLIEGIIEDQEVRKLLNNKIMKAYNNSEEGIDNIEQIGFVDYSKEQPQLMMAGGEFCGNATRSFAYDYLEGREGGFELKVSGVEKKLKAGVTSAGYARAEMPIYTDPGKIKEDIKNPGNYIVEMEGIVHYIENQGLPFDKTQSDFGKKIKEHAFELIKEMGLDIYPAAGIMYVNKIGNNIEMIPVVYVNSIDTLFLETACGSGTTALGLVESIKRDSDLKDFNVQQYSGMPIFFSVKKDKKTGNFSNAIISGPISKLSEGIINTANDHDVIIENTKTEEDLEYGYKNGLIHLYQELFSQAPYFEKYTDDEVREIFNEYFNLYKSGIYLAKSKGKIIGFGVIVPVIGSSVESVLKSKIEENKRDIENCYYMADLGVDPNIQRGGIGTDLVLSRINGLPSGSIIIMRTSLENTKSQGLYKKIGFQSLKDITEDVKQKRINDEEEEDTRLFLYQIKK